MNAIEVLSVGVSGCPVDEVAVVLRLPRGVTIQKGDLLVQAQRPEPIEPFGLGGCQCANCQLERKQAAYIPTTRFVKVMLDPPSRYIATVVRVTREGIVVRLRCNGREHTVPRSAIEAYPDESGIPD